MKAFAHSKGTTQIAQVFSDEARLGNLESGNVTINEHIVPYLPLYPRVNIPSSVLGDVGLFAFPGDDDSEEDFFTVRTDYNLGDNDTVHQSYIFDDGSGSQPQELGQVLVAHRSRRQMASLSWNHVFSPAFLNNVRIGYSRSTGENNRSVSLNPEVTDDPALGFVPGQLVGRLSVSGVGTFFGGTGSLDFNVLKWNSYQFYDDVTYQRQNHMLTFGFNFEAMQNDSDSPNSISGRYNFRSIRGFLTNGTAPGSRDIEFQAQLPGQAAHRGMRQKLFGAYLHDDYQVSPQLTLNLGVRYEATTVPTEVQGRLAALHSIFDEESTVGPLFKNPTLKYFSPRIGFAYDPFGSGKSVIRGGFSIYYILPLTHLLQPINNRATPFFNVVSGDVPSGNPLPDGLLFADLGLQRNSALEFDAPAAYKIQWNLTVQREIIPNFSLLLAYTGSRGIHQLQQEDGAVRNVAFGNPDGTFTITDTPVNPNFGRIDWRHWARDTIYHGFQTGLTLRESHGLRLQASYTWSKMLDNGTRTNSNNEFRTFAFNPVMFASSYNWGPSDYDVSHNFSFNNTYRLPDPRSDGMLKVLGGGWQLSSIFSISGGVPVTPTIDGDAAGLGRGARRKQRPLLAPGCTYESAVSPREVQYLDTSCFQVPSPPTALETAITRNAIRGPGLVSLDFSVFKNFPISRISEDFQLQFRAEFFNILNRTNFAVPRGRGVIDTDGEPIPSNGQIVETQTTSRQKNNLH